MSLTYVPLRIGKSLDFYAVEHISATLNNHSLHQYTMNKRELGRTGRKLNEVGYGSMSLSIVPHRMPDNDAIALIQYAVDECGIELIDTADSYCLNDDDANHSEKLLARALSDGRRDRVLVATKGGFTRPAGRWVPDGRPEHLRAACERSLKALQTDCIELYQFHTIDPKTPFEESLGCLRDLQAEGKIRWIGVSNFKLEQLKTAQSIVEIVSVQNPLNFISTTPDRLAVLDHCTEHSISYLAYAPLGGHRSLGRLHDYDSWLHSHLNRNDSVFAIAMAWLLKRSPVVIPIPASTKRENILANVQAASLTLSDEEMQILAHPQSWAEKYQVARATNNLQAALDALDECISLHPNEVFAYYDKACLYMNLEQHDQALQTLSTAIAKGFNDHAHLAADEDFAPLRDDARFIKMLTEMKG